MKIIFYTILYVIIVLCREVLSSASCTQGWYSNGDNCQKCHDSCLTCTNSTQCETCENYMFMNNNTNLCTFCSSGQYYDSTYKVCRNCDGKCNGLCLGQTSCFTCTSPNILDLESMACISKCTANKVSITSTQYVTGIICREPNFYIDPSSSQIVELGTKAYPYKTFRAMASDLLNNFSHKNLNITINVKENTQLYLSDNTNFVMNITSVKLTSYSDNSLSAGRATLVPTQIILPTTNLRTTFHILTNMDLNLSHTISAGTFSANEIDNINSNPSTFIVARSNFYIDNVDFKREPVDNFITSFFVFLVYLQDKWFDIRNINFNITGYAFRTYDPLNIYMENLYVDVRSLRGFSSFKATCNYPEAVTKGTFYSNNITVVTTSERPFTEDPSIIYYVGPANMTATNINLSGYYARAPSTECGICSISSSDCVPNDGIPHLFQFVNTTIRLLENSLGSKYNSIFIVQDQNVYRSIQANIDNLYSPIFETPFNPVIAAFGTTNAIIYITNSIFSSPKLKEDLMLIVLFQQVIISNITINNSLSIGSSLIRSEYIIAFVVKYMQLIDLGISEYTSKPLIFLSNFDFTYTVISNIYLNNCSLSGNQIVQNAAPLNQIIIANGYYQGLDLTSPTVLFSTGTIQSVIFQNHTFVNTTCTATDTSSTILSLENIDLNSTLDSMIAYVSTVGSEISIVKFGTLTNSPPAQRNILFQNIQVSNTNYTTSRSLIDTSNVVSTQNVAITFIGLAFSSISFAVQGQLLQFKHQLASPVVVVNSTFTNLVSSIVNIDSYGSKNASLNTKAQFSNCRFDTINSKYSSLIKTQSNAMAEFGYSNFTNIRTYEQAAVLYAGFEKTSVSLSHCMFANNSAVQGTVFVIESESVVNCANCTFVQNFAITGTVFQTSTNGYFVIADSNIYNNYAINNPVGELLDGANLCVISNSTVYSNQAMSVDTIKSEFNIKCSQLCFVSQDFIQYVNSNALLVPSKYEISLIQLIVSSLSIQSGSKISNEQIMFNIFLSTLTISDSIITNVTNSIQVSSSNMTIQNTQISNVANSAGIDFIFVTLGSIFEMDSSMFSNSSSSLLNARNSQIKISNATISRVNSPSKLVQITSCNSIDMAMLSVVNCTASDLVFFDFDTTTKISLSSFTGSQANSCFVQVQNSNVTTIDAFSIDKVTQPLIVKSSTIGVISNSNFTNNGNTTQRVGGAISMADSKVSIASTVFINNSAVNGGAIAFECTSLILCDLHLNKSTFMSNYASSQGGAIYYNYNRPVITNCIFSNNTAEYGPNFASYAVKIRMINSTSSSIMIDSMVSGMQYDQAVKLSLIDYDNQTMLLNNVNQITINPVNKTSALMKGTNTALLRNGVSSFSNLIVNTQPGRSNVQFQASSKAIDTAKVNEVYGYADNNLISANFRFCKPGEVQLVDDTCSVCAPGTYSLNWNSTACNLCPANSECLGGNQIYVDSGYWRKNSNTSTVVPCINRKACIGGFVDREIMPVNCDTGYTGILCNECVIEDGVKYSKVSDYECQKCPTAILNAIRIVGMVLLVLIFIIAIVVVNIRKTKESQMSVLLRILTNYLQLIASMMSFDIKYPTNLSDMFLPFSQIGSSSEVFMSFDCFVTDYDVKGPFSSNKIFKVFLSALLPVILLIVFMLIWTALKFINRKLVPDLQRNIIISFISIVFLLHPRLIQNSFVMFECVTVDRNDSRSKVNLDDTCFSSSHVKWILAIACPILVVWVISMPLTALILLYKNYKTTDDNKVKQYFLILYQGLRPEAFYWEFVNTLRKALLLLIFGILSFLGISFKILLSSIILIFSIRVQTVINPYKEDINNTIELRALVANIFTMIAAIIFVQENQVSFINSIAFILVIIVNIWFLLEWFYLFCLTMQTNFKIFKILARILAILTFKDCSILNLSINPQNLEQKSTVIGKRKYKLTGRRAKTKIIKRKAKKPIKKEHVNIYDLSKLKTPKKENKIDDSSNIELSNIRKIEESSKAKSYLIIDEENDDEVIFGRNPSFKQKKSKKKLFNKSSQEFSNIFSEDYMRVEDSNKFNRSSSRLFH